MKKSLLLFSLFIFLISPFCKGQKVGLVLSGGGARGLAHIGVIKAVEENHIPIDYITGTSIGAMIGGMYASGLSPLEIEKIVSSQSFENISKGILEDQYQYYYKKKDDNASLINLRLAYDSTLQAFLPFNVINTIPLDFALLEQFSLPNAKSKYNFDSLFIPFRCVASDIESKQQLVFDHGNLAQAIRASLAFPFYFPPVIFEDKMLFDGGLYNNFPAEEMLKDFKPDIIIGSNVSGKNPKPGPDNLISQLRTMVVNPSNFKMTENGILIEPKVDNVGLFSYDSPHEVIEMGYKAALTQIEKIKERIQKRQDSAELDLKRKTFKASEPKLILGEVIVKGTRASQAEYVKRVINPKNQRLTFVKLKENYFKLTADNNIKKIYPKLIYNTQTGYYDLELEITPHNQLLTQFGGNFSSRPISEAFLGLQYNIWRKRSIEINGNMYFGKLYNSGQLKVRVDFPNRFPFYLESDFTLNQWDFFKSSSTVFADIKPAYLVQSDKYTGLNFGIPARTKGKIVVGSAYTWLRNDYYQTSKFLQTDTADATTFRGVTNYISFERNTLNRKMYANEGTFLSIKARYINGTEYLFPGTTAIKRDRLHAHHNWLNFKITYQNYYKRHGRLKLGMYSEGVYSTQPVFSNYSSTVLNSPAFQPLPDSKTFFIEAFRAFTYAGLGSMNVFSLQDKVDLRLEGFMFQPYQEILRDENNVGTLGAPGAKRYFIASSGVVYHSPLGPVSLSINYYDKLPNPVSILFHFGYIMFNKKALE